VSGQYGVRDAACPVSTGGACGRGERVGAGALARSSHARAFAYLSSPGACKPPRPRRHAAPTAQSVSPCEDGERSWRAVPARLGAGRRAASGTSYARMGASALDLGAGSSASLPTASEK